MEERRINTILSLLLMIIFLTACASPLNTPTIEPTTIQTDGAPTPTTEPTTTVAGTDMPAPAAGLCANPYYPVREGSTWTYKSTGGPAGEYGFTDTITSVREDGFTLSTQFGDLTRSQEWACQPEGLVALQLGGAPAAMLNSQDVQLTLDVNDTSGVTFPSQINPGDQWQHNSDFEGNMSIMNQEGTATGNAQMSFTAVGNESVTVPAGTFDAMRVEVDTTLNFDVTYQGLSIPVTFSGTYTYWFAPDVGWVKASGAGTVAGTSFSETTELQSYNIP